MDVGLEDLLFPDKQKIWIDSLKANGFLIGTTCFNYLAIHKIFHFIRKKYCLLSLMQATYTLQTHHSVVA